jgi:hypothetical protein
MASTTTEKLQRRSGRPILRRVQQTPSGFRFAFDHGESTLILDTDSRGRELDAHSEEPFRLGWPSPSVQASALEQVRRVLLVRSFQNG